MGGRTFRSLLLLPSVVTALSMMPRLSELAKFQVLVLNADYQPLSWMPLSTWGWQDAIKAVWQERVDVVDTYEIAIRSASMSFLLPSVVVLKDYERKQIKHPRFSKRMLLLRDDYTCQYCGNCRDLTCDHVRPRSKGGKSEWKNTVAACVPCNSKKSDRLPEQSGMRLRRMPYEPTPFQLEAKARHNCIDKLRRSKHLVHASWLTYLLWDDD